MPNPTIQTDVESDSPADERINPKGAERLAMLDQISASRLSSMANEFAQIGEELPNFEAPRSVEEIMNEGNADDPGSKDTDLNDEPRKFKVKINGQEEEVDEQEIIRGYQKNEAASRRLTEASRKEQEIAERERALAEREAALLAERTDDPKQTQTQTTVEGEADDGSVKEFLDALYSGDEGKTTESFKRLMQGRSTPVATPDVTQIAAQVAPVVRQQISVESALAQFSSDFSDIVADPFLAAKCDSFVDQALKSGTPLDQALVDAGNSTREWIKQVAGVKSVETEKPTTQEQNTRLQRKQQIAGDRVQRASGSAADTSVIPEENPQSRSTTIAEMARARGKSI